MTSDRTGHGPRHRRHPIRLVFGVVALISSVTGLSTTTAWAGSPTSVTAVTASLTSPAAGAEVNWTVGFTTSSSGALAGSGSSVTVSLPAGASLGPSGSDAVTDTTSGQNLANDCGNVTSTTVTCPFDFGNPVAAGDVVSVALFAVTNPTTTGPATVSASTSSDSQPGTTSVAITAAKTVTGVTASETSTAAGAQVTWQVGFTASSTGILQGDANSTISVTLPTGTTFGSYAGGISMDTTTGNNIDYGCVVSSGTTLSCAVFLSQTVNPGDMVSITIRAVTNPTATGSKTVTVSTSSDRAGTTSVPITADQAVSGVSVAVVSTAATAETTWTIGLTTSSTGGLDYTAGSAVTVVLPTGTTFPVNAFSQITDSTTNQVVSYEDCSFGTNLHCLLGAVNTVHAGDVLSVLLRGVVNGPTAGPVTIPVTTSSDLTSIAAPLSLTPAQAVIGLTVTPGSAEAGVTGNWTFGFTASSTGAFAPYIGTVTVTLPPGTTFGSFTGGWVTDTTATISTYNCSVASGTTVSCKVYFPPGSAAGDVFTVVLDGVTNTLTTGPATVSLATSVDTKVATAAVTITGVTCAKVSGKLTATISLKKCTPKSATNKSAKGPGASLTSSGTLTWKKSHQTTVVSASASSVGQGGCPSGSTERDVTGSVTGGTSTYTHSGDDVHLRLCVAGSGAVSLVKGTTALF